MGTWTKESKNTGTFTTPSKNVGTFTKASISAAGNSFLLLENGFYLLLEDGFKLLLEQSSSSSSVWTKATKN